MRTTLPCGLLLALLALAPLASAQTAATLDPKMQAQYENLLNHKFSRDLSEVFSALERASKIEASTAADTRFLHSFRLGDWAQIRAELGQLPPDLSRRIFDKMLADLTERQKSGMKLDDILALVDALPPHMTVKEDTVELMSDLREAGHKLVYLSNMPLGLAQWIEQDHAFFQWFENGIFSARIQQVKPDPLIFKTAIEHLGLQETTPVFLDDMQRNIDVAVQHGWQGVRFVSASQARQELVGLGLLAS